MKTLAWSCVFVRKFCKKSYFATNNCFTQCSGSGSGSGSTCFWAFRIRIRILLSASKNSKKNLDSYFFVTSFGLFICEKDVNVLFGTDPDRNRVTWLTPSSEAIPFRRKPLGVRASYATRRKRRCAVPVGLFFIEKELCKQLRM